MDQKSKYTWKGGERKRMKWIYGSGVYGKGAGPVWGKCKGLDRIGVLMGADNLLGCEKLSKG